MFLYFRPICQCLFSRVAYKRHALPSRLISLRYLGDQQVLVASGGDFGQGAATADIDVCVTERHQQEVQGYPGDERSDKDLRPVMVARPRNSAGCLQNYFHESNIRMKFSFSVSVISITLPFSISISFPLLPPAYFFFFFPPHSLSLSLERSINE